MSIRTSCLFESALGLMRRGLKVRRNSWPKNHFLVAQNDVLRYYNGEAYVYFYPEQPEIMAKNWELYVE